MTEIKPCPWCGSEAQVGNLTKGIWDIECSSTNSKACPGYAFVIGKSEEGVIKDWNDRAGEAALTKRIEELEMALELATALFNKHVKGKTK
jgi:hypothetical protein